MEGRARAWRAQFCSLRNKWSKNAYFRVFWRFRRARKGGVPPKSMLRSLGIFFRPSAPPSNTRQRDPVWLAQITGIKNVDQIPELPEFICIENDRFFSYFLSWVVLNQRVDPLPWPATTENAQLCAHAALRSSPLPSNLRENHDIAGFFFNLKKFLRFSPTCGFPLVKHIMWFHPVAKGKLQRAERRKIFLRLEFHIRAWFFNVNSMKRVRSVKRRVRESERFE